MLVKWALVFFKLARACFGLEMLHLVVKNTFYRPTGVHLPANYMTMGKSLNLSQLQFLHPQNVDNNMCFSKYSGSKCYPTCILPSSPSWATE